MWTRAIEFAVMPPTSLFLAAALGLALRRRRPRLARALIAGPAAVALVLTIPWVGAVLLASLQTIPALPPGELATDAQAIVVLAAEHNPSGPEFGGPTVGPVTLERLRYAANLALRTDLPVLCSGGIPRRGDPPLSELMEQALEREFGIEVRWKETRSANTRENARFSAEILRAEGLESVLLVTHAWHMPRSVAAFEAAGVRVTPAPTGFRIWPALELRSFSPSARAFRESCWAVHEWLGRAWYALSG